MLAIPNGAHVPGKIHVALVEQLIRVFLARIPSGYDCRNSVPENFSFHRNSVYLNP